MDVFASEFADVLRVQELLPGAGTPYPDAGVSGLRRLYLHRVTCHFYFTFDEYEVVVRAFWGARRRNAPRFRT